MFKIDEFEKRMEGALEHLKREFGGVRTGRASASFLDPIKVDVYGALMPINQLATINVPEPRMITVQIWDRGMVKNVEKAIKESDLGLNPSSDGTLLRIPMPALTEERRKDLAKIVSRYAEEARVRVRAIRRDGMDLLKKLEKDNSISEDQQHKESENLQKTTDAFIKKIETLLEQKQKDIMQV